MSTSKTPYGYTATGRIRKRAVKESPPVTQTVDPLLAQRPEKFSICPIPTCNKSFQHRKDPHKAVWQHLHHNATSYVGDPVHKAAYSDLKEERNLGIQVGKI